MFAKYKSQWIGIGLVFITWLAFFSPILSGKYVYFLDDLKIIYYPIETVYAQFQHNWQLPLWANEFGFGQPLLAWGQLGFFTPIHVLLRALYVPPLTLLQASVVIYFLIGSSGMYAFLRRRLFSQFSASLGAVIFAYCGFSIGHLNHVNFYTSTMLLPLLLITIDALIKKPTLRRAGALAITGTVIAVSGQPQVIVYTFAIATVIGLALAIPTIPKNIRKTGKLILFTSIAGAVAFCLSALSILPLQEFVPNTERAAGLPYTELFEFSYPPYDTITMVFPYFFGGHDNYSGPKGFQELAAYVGIIPLLLTGVALWNWKKYKPERAAGLALATIGVTLALGRYSAVYTYLIDHHYIQTIGVVGRFVFFFDVGIVLLAASGLEDVMRIATKKWPMKIGAAVSGIVFPSLFIALPFTLYANQDPQAWKRFAELFSIHNVSAWALCIGIASFIAATFFRRIAWALPAIAAITLIIFGWNYNPRVLAKDAYTTSPFITDLQDYAAQHTTPARIYAAEHLPVTGNPHVSIKLSDYISPLFTIFQPLNITKGNLTCIVLPIQAESDAVTHMNIMIRSGFDGTIWYQHTLSSEDAFQQTNQNICFPEIPASEHSNLILSLSSDEVTNMKVFVTPSESDNSDVYFVRTEKQPTEKQLALSKKPLSVEYSPQYPVTSDVDSALLMRHIQAVAGASSATWIGALSVSSYRAFVDTFFANDADSPFDGDGIHALTRNRELLNFVGVTHLTQTLEYNQTNDPLLDAGYTIKNTYDTGTTMVNLYQNPNPYPRAFMVPKAELVAADDDIRAKMRSNTFNPKELVYLSAPTPPNLTDDKPDVAMQADATITRYSQTQVDVHVTTNKTAYLVLTDTTLPEWQTYIDGKPAVQLKADSLFKAAQVPAGDHIVSFQYNPPAVHKAKILSLIGIACIILMYAKRPRRIKNT